MNVVPAGVHHPHLLPQVGRALRRPERKVCVLGDRQRVHVGAHGHHRARLAAAEDGDDTRVCHLGPNVIEPERAEVIRDEPGRFDFPVAELGMLMNPVADLGDLRRETLDLAVDTRVLGVDRAGEADGGREGGEKHSFQHDGILARISSSQSDQFRSQRPGHAGAAGRGTVLLLVVLLGQGGANDLAVVAVHDVPVGIRRVGPADGPVERPAGTVAGTGRRLN